MAERTAPRRDTAPRRETPNQPDAVAQDSATHSDTQDARASAMGIGKRLISGVQDDDVLGLSAEIAYRFLFAVFPFGLFVAALGTVIASTLNVQNPAGRIIDALGDNLPPAIASALQPQLEQLFENANTGIVWFGAIAALWAATGGTNAVIKGIHRAYGAPEGRSFIVRYVVAVGLTLLAAVGIIASFVTVVGGAVVTQEAAEQVGLGGEVWTFIQLLRYPAVFAALTVAVAILYRYGPNLVVPWRWIFLGAAAFTLGWLIATAALGWYAANVADYGATYGSLGAVIVLMLWFYVTSMMLLLGAELTAAVARERTPDQIELRGWSDALTSRVSGATDEVRDRLKGAID